MCGCNLSDWVVVRMPKFSWLYKRRMYCAYEVGKEVHHRGGFSRLVQVIATCGVWGFLASHERIPSLSRSHYQHLYLQLISAASGILYPTVSNLLEVHIILYKGACNAGIVGHVLRMITTCCLQPFIYSDCFHCCV